MKKSVFAIASLFAASAAFAADYTWNGDGTYNLAAGDTLTFTDNATITAASTFTGSGTIIVAGGKLSLAYPMDTDKIPFNDFTGTVRIDSGAEVYAKGGDSFKELGDPYNKSALGANTAIVFNGGKYWGFPKENNSQFPNAFVLDGGTESRLENETANYGSGVNLRIRPSSSFSGAGKLTITQNQRWIEFASGFSASGLTGEVVLSGNTTAEAMMWAQDYGSGAKWTFDSNREWRIGPGNNLTATFGALDAQKGSLKFTNTNPTLVLGSRSGSDSIVNVPFTGNAFTLNKVGTSTKLTLGSAVTFVDGTTLDIDEGTLELDGCDISGLTTDFASGTTLKVTSNGGTVAIGVALANVDLTDGNLTFAGDSNWATGTETNLFTLSGTGFDASKIKVSGLGGNTEAAITLDGTTVKATITVPALEWNGTGTDWTDADAWTSGGNTYTFADGDKVTIPANATIALSSTVKPASVTISGAASLTGNGTITVDEFAGAGSLTVASGSVRLDGTLSVPLAIASGATAALGSQTLTNVGKTNVPNITGEGTLLVENANIVVTHQEQYNLFTRFDGDVKFAPGGYMEYLPTTADGNTQETNNKPLCQGKMIFAGGVLRGFSGTNARNNITFANDIEVVANTTSYITNNAARSSIYCNLSFSGKFNGSGVLWVSHGWNESRSCDFTGDLNGFEGAIHFIGGGFGKIKSANSSSEDMAWSIYQQDHLNIEAGNNSRLKLGALNNTRDGDRFNAYNSGMTYEIGGRNEDCEVKGNFYGNAITLVKTGAAKFTLGSSVTMVSGSTVIVSNGTFEINCSTALAAPVTVASGATLGGTGKCSLVTFEDGAKVDCGTLPENPAKGDTVDGVTASSFTWTQKPTVVQPAGLRGKWALRSRNNGNGTTTLYAEFAKPGFVLIVK